MLSNAYFIAKFRFDTAEKEPAKILLIFPILLTLVGSGAPLQHDQQDGRRGPHPDLSRPLRLGEVAVRLRQRGRVRGDLFPASFIIPGKS